MLPRTLALTFIAGVLLVGSGTAAEACQPSGPVMRSAQVNADIRSMRSAILLYRPHMGRLPTSLDELTQPATNSSGQQTPPFFSVTPHAPPGWTPYVYRVTGESSFAITSSSAEDRATASSERDSIVDRELTWMERISGGWILLGVGGVIAVGWIAGFLTRPFTQLVFWCVILVEGVLSAFLMLLVLSLGFCDPPLAAMALFGAVGLWCSIVARKAVMRQRGVRAA